MEATLVSASADGVAPAVLLSHSTGTQYLINVPEGFARLVLEHKIRPSAKLACILFTSLHPLSAGGVGGLILRLAQDGHGRLQVLGPRGSARYLHALRHIFRWRHPKVFVSDHTEKNVPVFEDDKIFISPILSGCTNRCPCCAFGDTRRKQVFSGASWMDEQELPELDEDSNPVFWYEQGRIHPLTSELVRSGESTGQSTVLGYTCFIKELEVAVVILDITDTSSLTSVEDILHCQKHPRRVAAVIHLSSKSALQSSAYQAWMKKHEIFHVPINSTSPQYGFKASLKTVAKLNLIDEKLFPLPRYDESTSTCVGEEQTFCGFLSRLVLEKSYSGILVRMDHSNCLKSFNFNQFQEEFLTRRPNLKEQIDNRNSRPCEQFSSNYLAAVSLRRSLLQNRAPAPDSAWDFELLFLGTGSAEPSKYRSSSGILLSLGGSTMLLDAGEGVFGQMVRRYGDKAFQLVQLLSCMWLSHKHADHVLGATGVICSRKELAEPLLVVGSTAVAAWLTEVRDALLLSGYQMPLFEIVHFEELTALQREAEPAQFPDTLRRVFYQLQLSSMINIPVHHCYEAYGLVLVGQKGWRIVYSGDTRPCERLVRAGAGCTLLIHEATFEDSLEDHARRKRHSTVSEAMELAREMQAQQLVLTHFSQRYPKVVDVDTSSYPTACMAFDGMVVSRRNMTALREILSIIGLVLAEDPWMSGTDFPEALPEQPPVSTHIRWSDLDTERAGPKHIRFCDPDEEEG